MKLVEATHILCSTQITDDQLNKSAELLQSYVHEFEDNYGQENMLFNVHLLLHTTKCVRKNGPLFTYSNYLFEDYIGVLARSVLGPTDIVSQVTTRYLMTKNLERHLQDSPSAKAFNNRIAHNHYSVTWKYGNFIFVGKPTEVNDTIVCQFIQNELQVNVAQEVCAYRAVFIDKKIFFETVNESDKKKTSDAFVCIPENNIYGEIICIIKERQYVHFVINNKYKLDEIAIQPFIYKLIPKEDELCLIQATDLHHKYALVKTNKMIICAKFPNLYERN